MAPPPQANVKPITILLLHSDSILGSYWWVGSQVVNLAKLTPHQQAQDQLWGVRGAKRVHYKYKLCEP